MDQPTLQQRLQAVEGLLERMAENIAFQGRMIATLDRGGHDVKAAKMFSEATGGQARQTRRRPGSIVHAAGEPLTD
jgi:hypothetical protein